VLFLLLVVSVLSLSACTTINLPSVTDRPTNLSLSGKIVWHDLISDTPEASERFYSELFGWEFEPVGKAFGLGDDINYSLIRHNGRLIGGMVNENKLQRSEEISQWITLMSVSDIHAAIVNLEAAGGIVFTPPTELADRGWLAVVSDPQGAIFALVQTNSGDPVDRKPKVGEFLWSEVWTSDVDSATDFYGNLAGYDKETTILDDDFTYRMLGSANRPRIGLVKNPMPEMDPVWVSYIRVEDPAPILERVEELGGTILLDTRERDAGGKVALITGPSGAGIALQTWDPENTIVTGGSK
jgi:predicted enzyme related to lactoylglutathione lyase